MNEKFLRLTAEDKLILQGIIYTPEQKTKKAYLHIHGMAGNFYENRFLDFMTEGLMLIGYAFMSINTRGHDMIADFALAEPEEKYKRIGNSYEKFEECLLDIKPAIDYLEKEGYSEIVLCGHSLGCSKVAYYLAQTQDVRIQKLILMSPSDMVQLFEAESNHLILTEQANKMISEGKGAEFIPVKIWDWYYLSASTFLDFSTRDFPIDVFNTYDKDKLSLLNKIKIPVLAFFGENDDAAGLYSKQETLDIIKKKTSNAQRFDTVIIKGASHGYFNREKEMTQEIIDWLNN